MWAGYHLTLWGNYIKPHTPFYKYMNKIITADYFPGQDCDCEARSSYECGCDADWTPVEVYKLREDAKQLADRLTALELKSTSELARLEQERDEALSQIAQAEKRAERYCQERDEAREHRNCLHDLHNKNAIHSKELLELLNLSNSVYILKLKSGWYIGSFIETTLRFRLTNHDCFKNDTFMSIYCIINVSPDSYIDAAVIERCMQNYAASVLKISKNSIYKCGVQGFTATEEQIKEVMYTLSGLST